MPINLGCQRNQQQPAGQNCPKNPSGLLSVTIFKQPRLPGDRQHSGSKVVLMQDLAQGAGGGTGTWKTHQGPAFPLSIHAALSQCPELNPPSSPQESMDGSGMSAPSRCATEPVPLWGSALSQRNPSLQSPCPAWLGDGAQPELWCLRIPCLWSHPWQGGKGPRKQVLRLPWLG